MVLKRLFESDEPQEVAYRSNHRLANMVSPLVSSVLGTSDKTCTYLGCSSASRITVSIPSRASTAAAYDPAGPPPAISTVHRDGIEVLEIIVLGLMVSKFDGTMNYSCR